MNLKELGRINYGALSVLILSFLTTAVNASTGWESGETSLAGMALDGSPALSFTLGHLRGSPEFSFPISLEHRLDAKAEKLAVPPNAPANTKPKWKTSSTSQWLVPQLVTRLVPADRDHLVWQQPGGGHVWFKAGLVTHDFSPAGAADWEIREAGGAAYEIRHRENGLHYRYLRGQLVEINHEVTGRVLKITSATGRITKIEQKETAGPLLVAEYDKSGALTALTLGPVSHHFEWAAASGQLSAWSTGKLKSWAFAYETIAPDHNLLTGVNAPDGSKQIFKWAENTSYKPEDDNDPISKPYVLSQNSHGMSYGYAKSARGYELSATSPGPRMQKMLYNPAKGLLERSAPDGSKLAYEHRARQGGDSLLRKVTGPDGLLLLDLRYDTEGNVLSKTAFGEPVEEFRYDDQRRLVEVKRAGKLWTSYTYDSSVASAGLNRRPVRVKDASGAEMVVSYDRQGQVVSSRDPDGNTHRFSYDALGHPVAHELPTGLQRHFVYDAFGRITDSQQPDGSRQRLRFNDLGLVSAAETTSAFGAKHTWDYEYNALGHATALKRDGQTWLAWERAPLAGGGERLTRRDPLGHVTKRDFDAEERLLREENALGETLTYAYNAAGDLSGWTDARGALASFQKDVMGRIIGQTDALQHGQTSKFDKMGRLTQRKTGEQNIGYAYDDQGRLATVDYGHGQQVAFSYDAEGNMTQASTAEATMSYQRDALGRPVAKLQKLSDGTTSGVAYEYTPGGRKKSVSLLKTATEGKADAAVRLPVVLRPDNGLTLQRTEYRYDALGRIIAIVVDGKEQVTCAFDPKTLTLSEKTFASGLKLKYAYDTEGRPSGLLAPSKEGKPLRVVAYEWNAVGQLAKRTLTGFRDKAIVQSYSYDALGRLSKVDCPAAPDLEESFQHDKSGNITQRRSGAKLITMTYDLANQLIDSTVTKVGAAGAASGSETTAFTYDKAGRMIRETQQLGTTNREPRTASYTYGYLDKVLKVQRSGGSDEASINHQPSTINFHYGPDGMLLGKTKDGKTESWTWDGLALLSRGRSTFVNEPHASGGVPLIEHHRETVMKRSALGQTYEEVEADRLLLSDYLGTTLDTLDSEKDADPKSQISDHQSLTSLGSTTSQGRFTGKPYDADLGAHVFPFRNYRSDLGRWASADPSGFPDGPNGQFYAPVGTVGIDPMGLETQTLDTNVVSETNIGVTSVVQYDKEGKISVNNSLLNGPADGTAMFDVVIYKVTDAFSINESTVKSYIDNLVTSEVSFVDSECSEITHVYRKYEFDLVASFSYKSSMSKEASVELTFARYGTSITLANGSTWSKAFPMVNQNHHVIMTKIRDIDTRE